MIRLDGITSRPKQRFRTPLADGSLVEIKLIYRPAIEMWFISVSRKSFELKNFRVCVAVNLLDQFTGFIPFGIGVGGKVDPFLVNSFSSGQNQLFIWERKELQALDEAYQVVRDV